MSLFSFTEKTERTGVIIDIGSASVLVAIVVSNSSQNTPVIIWSHREHTPLKSIESLEQSAKAVITSLVNALLKFDVEGRRALYEYKKTAKIQEIQYTIAAPWSHTVTKSINYTEEEPFTITEGILEELIRTATEKTKTDLEEHGLSNEHDLTFITRSTLNILANGYRIKDPLGEKTSDLSIAEAIVVTKQSFLDAIYDLHKKLFHGLPHHILSYILMLESVTKDLHATEDDISLVHVTYEATELGVIRDGTLKHSSHVAFGIFSLAREIATITSVPLYEAFKYLHEEKPLSFLENLPETQRNDIETVFEAYVERIATLFSQTGDELSIPKQIFLHSDLETETLLRDLIEKAAKRKLKSDPIIHLITPIITNEMGDIALSSTVDATRDTAILVSSRFFHKQNPDTTFEYL